MNQKTKEKLVELKLEAESKERYYFNRLMDEERSLEENEIHWEKAMERYYTNMLAESRAYLKGINDMLKILNLKK